MEPSNRANLMLSLAYVAILAIVFVLVLGHVDGNTAVGGCLIMLVGKFSGDISKAFDFEFGSTRGSQTKDATIASMSDSTNKVATAALAATKPGGTP